MRLLELIASTLALCAAMLALGGGSAQARAGADLTGRDVVSYPTGGSENPCGQPSATGWLAIGAGQEATLTAAFSGDIQHYIYLTGSVSPSYLLEAGSGNNLTIDLCGYDLSVSAPPPPDAAIAVASGEGLTIEDTSSTDPAQQGTLTAIGTGAPNVGTGAGIGGSNPQVDSGAVTIDSGNVIAVGGSASGEGGAAGIGGGNQVGQPIGTSGPVTINGGTVTAQGGDSVGVLTGGGAGIGGAGGSASTPSSPGGNAEPVTISGGQVSAYGGNGNGYGGGAGSAIGGGGGSFGFPGGQLAGVTLSGGSIYTQFGLIGGGGTEPGGEGYGIGGGGGGYLAGAGSSGTITIGAGSGGGTVEFAGWLGGSIHVEPQWTLDIPTSIADTSWNGSSAVAGTDHLPGVQAAAGGVNDGLIDVGGEISEIDPLSNTNGVIVTEPGGVASGVGLDSPPDIDLNIDYPAAESTDDASIAYGADAGTPTLALAGLSLPPEPSEPGETGIGWEADGTIVTSTTDLNNVASGDQVELTAGYETATPPAPPVSAPDIPAIEYTLSGTKGANGWYSGPVTVTFTCGTVPDATVSCPAPVTLDTSGRNQSASGTASATSTADSSLVTLSPATAFGIDIDLSKPSVSISGAKNGKTYTKAPKPTCKARDSVSGIASCRLTSSKKNSKSGYVETLTALATSNSGATARTSLKFAYKKPTKKKHG